MVGTAPCWRWINALILIPATGDGSLAVAVTDAAAADAAAAVAEEKRKRQGATTAADDGCTQHRREDLSHPNDSLRVTRDSRGLNIRARQPLEASDDEIGSAGSCIGVSDSVDTSYSSLTSTRTNTRVERLRVEVRPRVTVARASNDCSSEVVVVQSEGDPRCVSNDNKERVDSVDGWPNGSSGSMDDGADKMCVPSYIQVSKKCNNESPLPHEPSTASREEPDSDSLLENETLACITNDVTATRTLDHNDVPTHDASTEPAGDSAAVRTSLSPEGALGLHAPNTAPWHQYYGEDEYEHVQEDLVYVATALPGPGLDLELFEQMPLGCRCTGDCSPLSAAAQQPGLQQSRASGAGFSWRSKAVDADRLSDVESSLCSLTSDTLCKLHVENGTNMNKDQVTPSNSNEAVCECHLRTPPSYAGGLLLDPCLPWPVYECNDDCQCCPDGDEACSSRVVQRGPRKHLSVVRVEGKVQDSSNVDAANSSVDIHSAAAVKITVDNSTTAGVRTASKGYGVVTSALIPRGAFVCEYAGELLGQDEARRRFAAQERAGTSNYIMVLREFTTNTDNKSQESPKSWFHKDVEPPSCQTTNAPDTEDPVFFKSTESDARLLQTPSELAGVPSTVSSNQNQHASNPDPEFPQVPASDWKPQQVTIIDPTVIGNIGRYLNHSCAPNVHVVPVRVNSLVPLAAMFASRDISAGEELVYDYASVGRPVAPNQEDARTEGGKASSLGKANCWADQLRTLGRTAAANREDACSEGGEAGMEVVRATHSEMVDGVAQVLNCREHRVGCVKQNKVCSRVADDERDTRLEEDEIERKRSFQKVNRGTGDQESASVDRNAKRVRREGSLINSRATNSSHSADLPPPASWSAAGGTVPRAGRSQCYCGASRCRGYLPAERDLF